MSTTTHEPLLDPDDSRLTAYALGELTDEAERAEIERALRRSPEVRAAVEEIRALTAELTAEYEQERKLAAAEGPANIVVLPDLSREERREAATTARRTWMMPALRIAAILIVFGGLAYMGLPVFHQEQPRVARPEVAMNAPDSKVLAETARDASVATRSLAQTATPTGSTGSVVAAPAAATPTSALLAAAKPVSAVAQSVEGERAKKPTEEIIAEFIYPQQFQPPQIPRQYSSPGEEAAASGVLGATTSGKPQVGDLAMLKKAELGTAKDASALEDTVNVPAQAGAQDNRLAVQTPAATGPQFSNLNALRSAPEADRFASQNGLNAHGVASNAMGGGEPSTVMRPPPTRAAIVAAKEKAPTAKVTLPSVTTAAPVPQYEFQNGSSTAYQPAPVTMPGMTGRGVGAGGGNGIGNANGGRATVAADRTIARKQAFYAGSPAGAVSPAEAQPHLGLQNEATAGTVSPAEDKSPGYQALTRQGDDVDGEHAFFKRDRVVRRDVSQPDRFDTAAYDHLIENSFLPAKENPLSTFSIDVDTASYSNVRRFIEAGSLPPKDAVRVEELLNYFPYSDAPPAEGNDKPFAIHLEAAACPWDREHRLVRVGIKGRELARDKRPASNLVFLLDVSGSMEPQERLPLIKRSLSYMVERLREEDRVAIVVYAGASGLVLPSTTGDHQDRILQSLDKLQAGGSTNGASGIQLAYKLAREHFIKGGTNRVILATDGDFNVGVTSQGELIRLIEKEAKSGVFLSVLGVGTDNYKDSMMVKLADKGNGNYAYLDKIEEGKKVLVEQMSGTLVTIAKDVKIQVEFNPATVAAYRLIGYEKRMLKKEDFNDDRVDAGEIGAGHNVTALYEVVPAGRAVPMAAPGVDALKYGAKRSAEVVPTPTPTPTPDAPDIAAVSDGPAPSLVPAGRELLTVKMRHKAPDSDKSERTYEVALVDNGSADDYSGASKDFKFSAAVASFGMILRDSPYKGNGTLGAAIELAQEGRGEDVGGYRAGFIELARKAQAIGEEDRPRR